MKISSLVFIKLLICSCLSGCISSAENKSISPNNVSHNSSNLSVSRKISEKDKNKWTSLSPSKFDNLPKEIIQHLQSLDCAIPQAFYPEKPHNVIEGEFFKKGQKDWAVLCFRNNNPDNSVLFAYPNGSIKNVVKVTEGSDENYFQDIDGKGTVGFSRAISPVDKKYIADHFREYGGTKPPPIDHDGINDAFVEKASTVLYFYRGRWLELQGAD